MKLNELKWPESEGLTARAQARLRDLQKLVEWHKLNEQELDIVQKELDILATMRRKREEPEDGTL